MGSPQGRDVRWCQLRDAVTRLYGEVDGDAEITALAVTVRDPASGQEMYYATGLDHDRVDRRVLTDLGMIADAAARGTVDANPPEQVPGG